MKTKKAGKYADAIIVVVLFFLMLGLVYLPPKLAVGYFASKQVPVFVESRPQTAAEKWEFRYRMLAAMTEHEGLAEYDLKILLSQICLETGNGTSRIFREKNNLLGIRRERSLRYHEFGSWRECLDFFCVKIVLHPKAHRYLKDGDIKGYGRAMQGSWATDKDYAAKLATVYRGL